MEEQAIHAFFQKKHKKLASDIASAIREMKKEGLVEKYKRESMANPPP